ncbi:uncharacterized protein FOMMEDRAFT_131233 [Fomitiporia mediterranea MF3/22]|uniref:uncharacterized protein n=1 Tax=Fomitiporia mediterranea (strain MF3/22) TaxID=694068 RepID=UPI0004407862|nr:uncharacterized protein FOMMEDRAFT_131233 [Fomitiporia mediterranea MF3/22]EJD08492.1 hypothetical protein FOMMEDRAFT_131233 [Fomitiporia mediterranea MF3/22]
MSSTAPSGKFQFLAYCPDKSDEGLLQRRLSVRERHLENAKKLGTDGIIKFGRAFVSPESVASPNAEQKMVGSLIIYEASSLEEAKKLVQSDIYYTAGVWDPERIMIHPLAGSSLYSKKDEWLMNLPS